MTRENKRYLRNIRKNDLCIKIDESVSNDVFWNAYINTRPSQGFAIINAIEMEIKRNSNGC